MGVTTPLYYLALGYGPQGIGSQRPANQPGLPGPMEGPFSLSPSHPVHPWVAISIPVRPEVLNHLTANNGRFHVPKYGKTHSLMCAPGQFNVPPDLLNAVPVPYVHDIPRRPVGPLVVVLPTVPAPAPRPAPGPVRTARRNALSRLPAAPLAHPLTQHRIGPYQRRLQGLHHPVDDLRPTPPRAADVPFRRLPWRGVRTAAADSLTGGGALTGQLSPPRLLGKNTDDLMDVDRALQRDLLSGFNSSTRPPRGYGGLVGSRLAALSQTGPGEQAGAATLDTDRPPSPGPVSGPRSSIGTNAHHRLAPFGPLRATSSPGETDSYSDLFPAGDFGNMAVSSIPSNANGRRLPAGTGADCKELTGDIWPDPDRRRACAGRGQAAGTCADHWHSVPWVEYDGGQWPLCNPCHDAGRTATVFDWSQDEVVGLRSYPCTKCVNDYFDADGRQYHGTGTKIFGRAKTQGADPFTATNVEGDSVGGSQGSTP